MTGWAGCRLHRVGLLDGLARDGRTQLPVPLALGVHGRLRPNPRTVLTHARLDEEKFATRAGILTTGILKSTLDAARQAPDLREATVVLDIVTAAKATSLQRIRDYVEQHPRLHGIERARAAAALASEHSRSPYETLLRLVWVLDAQRPPVLANCTLEDLGGRVLGVADLLDIEAGLVVEFDGEDHRSRERHGKDVSKEDALRQLGLEVTRVTGTDLRDTTLVVTRLRAARGRALFEPVSARRWRARPAAETVEEHLLREEERVARHEALMAQPMPSIEELRRW